MFRGLLSKHQNMKETSTEKVFNKKQAEQTELNILIKKGIAFELESVTYKRKGIFGKNIKVKEALKFKIQEPTLSTLDRLAAEQIELVIDEKVMSSEYAITEAKNLTSKQSRRLARIIAIAVLGQDYVHAKDKGSHLKYSYDNKSLDRLTDLFFHFLKPSDMMQIVVLINTVSNLGDFCNSIRLMSASRTTMPIRIEEDKED